MIDRLNEIVQRYDQLTALLASPEVAQDPDKIRQYAQEQAELEEQVQAFRAYSRVKSELEGTRMLLESETDPEMRALAEEELAQLEAQFQEHDRHLQALLAPKDPRDARDVIVEIRAGAGGDEAALFAADLFRMYNQYAANHRWHVEVLSASEIGIGGYKEVIFSVKGRGAYSRLKYESGVHRVQRVPSTEAAGRIHTSTATVAVLPEVDEVEVEINERDLRIDVYRSAGKGGQGVNTTDSAVRITHLPTGIVAQCQDERSQLQNKARAMSILRARLYDLEYQRQMSEQEASRRSQVGSAERSEKIRTYNFAQNRVTDHRIGLSIHRLESVLAGELDPFIDQLAEAEHAERLKTG